VTGVQTCALPISGRFSSSTAVVHSASYPGEGESSSSVPVVVLRS